MILNIILFLDSLGAGELLLIFVVVLLFFGPKSIPGIAKGMGKATREFRNAMNDVRSEIETSMNAEEKKQITTTEAEKPSIETEATSLEITSSYKAPERKVFGESGDKK